MGQQAVADSGKELKSEIGLISAMSIVVGVVLGAGAFMKPPAVLAAAGDSTTALLAWLIGGMFSMAGGLTLCELGVMFPRTGGVYVYLEEIFGEKVAFLYGWMIVFLFGPATVGALTGYFSSVFCLLFSIPEHYAGVVGAAALAFVTFVNSVSVKAAGRVQTIATLCKLLPIVLLTVFGLWKGSGQVLFMHSSPAGAATSFSVAVLATLFAYDGWAQVASLGGEIKNPSKILPRAIIGGLTFLVVVYLAINVALLKVIPADQLVALGHDASTIVAQKLFGLAGGNVISVGIMIAMIGGLNGYTMTLSRVLYSMGVRGQMPGSQLWGKIDSDSNTPVNAILFLVFNAFIYNLLFDADKLSNIASFSNWIFYMLTFIAVFIARKTHAHVPRSYKVPLYPVVPLIAIGGALYVFYGMLSTEPIYGVFSVGLTLAGLPVYYYMTGSKTMALPGRLKTKYMVGIGSLIILALLTISVRIIDPRPEIRVATEPASPPVSFEEKGNITGFDIELMNAAADRAGLKVTYRAVSLEHMFTAVNQNYVDAAVCSLSITPERQASVAFTQPYIENGGKALLVKQGSGIKSHTGLAGKTVGVHAGSTSEAFASGLPGAKVQVFHSNLDMATAFNQGALDAIIFDRPILEHFMSQNIVNNAMIIENIDKEQYGIVYANKNKALGEKLDKALAEMKKNGELAALQQKWFGKTLE